MLRTRPARLSDEDQLRPIHLATWTADVSPGPTPGEPVLDVDTLAFLVDDAYVDDLLLARRLDDGVGADPRT